MNRPLARTPYGDHPARPVPVAANPFADLARDPVGADLRRRGEWYRIGPPVALAPSTSTPGDPAAADEDTATRADVYLFDTIGGWFGTYAEDLVKDVASLDVDELHVHLNSPGGEVSEGVAIANVLRQHRARVTVWVDGIAASAASVVAMAGDEVVMSIGSQMMIHDAWSVGIGNAAELRKAAEMLDSTSDALAATYAAKTGGTAAEWREVMRAEQWYTADEAVAAGLADRVATADDNGTATGDPIRPGASSGGGFWDMWDTLRDPSRFDLSAYNYAGRDAAPPPAMPGRQTPAASAAGATEHERSGAAVAFTDEQLTTLRQKLGLADDADEQTIVDATVEALDEQADTPTGDPALAGASASVRLPDGVVAVDAAQLEQLRRDAQAGAEARARQVREDRERLVQAAIADGRIAPARREHWVAALDADHDGAAATLAALTPGLVPVGPAMGHDAPQAQTDPAAADDYWFPGYATPASTHARD